MPDLNDMVTGESPTSHRFTLVIDNVPIGYFLEVSGLEMHVGVEEFSEGGQNGFVHKFPGRITWPNLVFRRGITQSDALFKWVSQSSGAGYASNKNQLNRTTGAVSIVDWDGKPLRTWSLIDPFPVRWSGPKLSAKESTVLEEEVEVAHHGFTATSSNAWQS